MNTEQSQSKMQDDFTAFIQESELAQTFLAKKRSELAAARREKIDVKNLLQPELDKTAATITELHEKHLDALIRLESEKQKIYAETYASLTLLKERRQMLEREISEQDGFLLTHYEPAIDEAIDYFRKKEDVLRKPENHYRDVAQGQKNANDICQITVRSNNEAILAACSYCREAVKKLEELKFTKADFDSSIVDQLKQNLPNYKILTESNGRVKLKDNTARDILGV